MKTGTIFENPLLHFSAYGLANPTVVWALERGLYDAWCRQCRGTGSILLRPSSCVTDRPKGARLLKGTHRGSEGCQDCRRRCPSCRGRKLQRDQRTVCRQDFLGEDDMAVAEALIPGITLDKDFNERQLR